MTIDACFSLEKDAPQKNLVQNKFECNGISAKLFMHVIHAHSPIQKRILISFMWLGLIVYILEMSVQLVIQRDELQDLNGLVSVITQLFVAFIPKLIGSIRFTEISILDKKQIQEIKAHIRKLNSNSSSTHTPIRSVPIGSVEVTLDEDWFEFCSSIDLVFTFSNPPRLRGEDAR